MPVLGYLFRGERTSKTKTNLIIFITPQIVRDSAQMRGLVLDELRDRQDRIDGELLKIYGRTSAEAGSPAPVPATRPSLSGPR